MKQKHLVWAVAGATVILSVSGCAKTQLMGDRNITPAIDDPSGQIAATPLQPAPQPMQPQQPQQPFQPEIPSQPDTPPPAAPRYEAMTGVQSSGGVSSAKRSSRSTGKSVAGNGFYIVKKNDNPDRIARKLGVRLVDLMRVNNLTEKTARTLQVGKKLTIPAKRAAVSRKSGKKSADIGTVSGGKYKVRPGDNPDRIARRFKIKVRDLMKANNLTEKSARTLQVGQSLIIPGSSAAKESSGAVTAKSGNKAPQAEKTAQTPAPRRKKALVVGSMVEVKNSISMRDFAAEHNVSFEDLKEINFDKGETLNAGDWVYMPVAE